MNNLFQLMEYNLSGGSTKPSCAMTLGCLMSSMKPLIRKRRNSSVVNYKGKCFRVYECFGWLVVTLQETLSFYI